MNEDIIVAIGELRETIQGVGNDVKGLMEHAFLGGDENPNQHNRGEMKANIMLAYRHMEDARMRLGKVIQAHEGGESIYDKKAA